MKRLKIVKVTFKLSLHSNMYKRSKQKYSDSLSTEQSQPLTLSLGESPSLCAYPQK